jgi:hypothetical protein
VSFGGGWRNGQHRGGREGKREAAEAALSKLYPAMGSVGSRGQGGVDAAAAVVGAPVSVEVWLHGLSGQELAGLQGLFAAEAFRQAAAGDT